MVALAALENTGDTSSSESENEEVGGGGVEEKHIKEGENYSTRIGCVPNIRLNIYAFDLSPCVRMKRVAWCSCVLAEIVDYHLLSY